MLGLWELQDRVRLVVGEAIGLTIELEVTNIAHGGVSVARHDGRVIFVSDAIPGERVLARISEDSKKSFWRAESVAVLEPSEHRVEHVWSSASIDRDPHDRAGGAEFGHIALAHQRTLKGEVLVDALQRMARVTAPVRVEAAPGDDDVNGLGWRTRIRLQVDESGQPGPFAARSHRVIPVDDLPLATGKVAEIAPLAQRFTGASHVDILGPSSGPARVIRSDEQPGVIKEVVGDRQFQLAESGFWQVHRMASAVLTEAVQAAIDPARFDPAAQNLDLYGGVGLLAAAVGDRFGAATRITSVEGDAAATRFASANLGDFSNATAVTGRVERWLGTMASGMTGIERDRFRSATVILDPPRSGAGRDVVEQLVELAPNQVVYVACDPVALARDLAFFDLGGFRLDSLRAIDLFPHTHHLEAVASLSRH